MINPDGVRTRFRQHRPIYPPRADGRGLFERGTVAVREWAAIPFSDFLSCRGSMCCCFPRQDQPRWASADPPPVPSAAAIADAIYDATGVRFREPRSRQSTS